jgi:hypothetical protein
LQVRYRCSVDYMTGREREELETALIRWGEQRRESDAARDDLIRAALAAGITKHRVFVLTGIARTTIDRIIGEEAQ